MSKYFFRITHSILLWILIAMASGAVAAAMPTKPHSVQTKPTPEHVMQLSLKDLGEERAVRLVGGDVASSIDFSFHTVDIVKRLRLKLHYSYSNTLNPQTSYLQIALNGQPVGKLALPKGTSENVRTVIEIDPLYLQDWNHLSFQFISHLEKPFCDNPRDQQLWIQLNNKDTLIEADVDTLPLSNELTLFPLPFFDKHDIRDPTLTVVLPKHPSWGTLKSAGIMASWFGSLVDWRKVHYASYLDALPMQDAIVLATASDHIEGLVLPPISNGVATISVVKNPRNPNTSLLLIVGRDEESLIKASQALVLGKVPLEGDMQSVQVPSMPKHIPFDSTKWLPIGGKIPLGDIVPAEKLSARGLFLTPHQMVLHLPPNIYRAETTSIPVDFSFESSNNTRYLTRIEAFFNDIRFQYEVFDKPIETAPARIKHRLQLNIPTKNLTGRDTITVRFVFTDKTVAVCNEALVIDEIKVDPHSIIDLSKLSRYVELPDLSYLAYTAYPFSKYADLSETAVLMPDTPDQYEIDSMLTMLGHIGNKTGAPATAISISSINAASKFADKDILVVGGIDRLRTLLDQWKSSIPVNLLSDDQPYPYFGSHYVKRWLEWFDVKARFNYLKKESEMVVAEFESPMQSQRGVVILAAKDTPRLVDISSTLNTFWFAKNFVGDVSVISEKAGDDRVTTFELAKKFSIGQRSFLEWARNFIQNNPWLAIFISFVIALFFSSMTYRAMRRRVDIRLARVE
ncbi:MAG: cellulose biosynthesis cyclic di-GMP-binding regulatory protein BcsB [Gallionella sp.]|nr:cellulose biosynthesis cyclic di-GMP-binding regulatory protein BcsB [Gallionella sp.]